jgi:hypothetical protein
MCKNSINFLCESEQMTYMKEGLKVVFIWVAIVIL